MLDTQVPEAEMEVAPQSELSPEFHEPPGSREPLSAAVSLPAVKRFSPKAIGIVGAVAAVVMIAAFSGLAKKPATGKTAEPNAQKAPQPGSAVAALPPDYGRARRPLSWRTIFSSQLLGARKNAVHAILHDHLLNNSETCYAVSASSGDWSMSL